MIADTQLPILWFLPSPSLQISLLAIVTKRLIDFLCLSPATVVLPQMRSKSNYNRNAPYKSNGAHALIRLWGRIGLSIASAQATMSLWRTWCLIEPRVTFTIATALLLAKCTAMCVPLLMLSALSSNLNALIILNCKDANVKTFLQIKHLLWNAIAHIMLPKSLFQILSWTVHNASVMIVWLEIKLVIVVFQNNSKLRSCNPNVWPPTKSKDVNA